MSEPHLTKTKLADGVWHGILTGVGDRPPQIEVLHAGTPIPDVTLKPGTPADQWAVTILIPPAAIADGINTLIIRDTGSDTKIGHITLIAGETLDDDIHAELDLLRAELDMLKRAFRRHCVATA